MQIPRIAAVLVGGLFLATASFAQGPSRTPGAMAGTDLAYATPAPRGAMLVVLQSDNTVPASALPAIERAAAAAKAGRTVEVLGSQVPADIVRRELLREGVSASAIVVARDHRPAPRPLDPLDDIARRAVTLRY